MPQVSTCAIRGWIFCCSCSWGSRPLEGSCVQSWSPLPSVLPLRWFSRKCFFCTDALEAFLISESENYHPMCCCYQKQSLTHGLPLEMDAAGTWHHLHAQVRLLSFILKCLVFIIALEEAGTSKDLKEHKFTCSHAHQHTYTQPETHIKNSPTQILDLRPRGRHR